MFSLVVYSILVTVAFLSISFFFKEIETLGTLLLSFISSVLAGGIFYRESILERVNLLKFLMLWRLEKKIYNLEIIFDKPNIRREFLLAFGLYRTEVSSSFLESLSDKQSSIFILGMQYFYESIKFCKKLTVVDFQRLCNKAVNCPKHRELLLKIPLEKYFGNKIVSEGLASIVRNQSSFFTGHDIREKSDSDFINRIEKSKNEIMYIYSTTSQISSDILDSLALYSSNIKKIKLFICSPFCITDAAIKELQKEYRVPNFCVPINQFIVNSDGTPHLVLDSIRRVVRILTALDRVLKFQETSGVKLEVCLFKNEYPGIKIRILAENKYAQIQPGPLNYANNLYRYGIDTNDSEIVSSMVEMIENMSEDQEKIDKFEMTRHKFEKIRDKAIREAAQFLVVNSISADILISSQRRMNLIIKDPSVDLYIDEICRAYSKTLESLNNFRPFDKDSSKQIDYVFNNSQKSENYVGKRLSGTDFHVSVGIIFVKNGRVLLIKKSHPFYHDKFSIVAGHLQPKESARAAILREVKEEIGVVLDEYQLLKHVESVDELCRYAVSDHEWFVFYSAQRFEDQSIILDEGEISSFEWVDFSKLGDYVLTDASRSIFEKLGFLG